MNIDKFMSRLQEIKSDIDNQSEEAADAVVQEISALAKQGDIKGAKNLLMIYGEHSDSILRLAGKLRDINTNANFQARIRINRENLSKNDNGKPEVDLYKEYYPDEVVNEMMRLDQMDTETRKLLLQKF